MTKLVINTKSSTSELVKGIETDREEFSITKDDTIVDQDGVGGGVVDEGEYHGFQNNAGVMEDPKTQIKENYKDIKAQCAYRFFEKVNRGEFSIDPENIWIDGVRTTTYIQPNGNVVDVLARIKKELRAIKRLPLLEGKKRINSKDDQKIILNGLSPDFFDTFMMHEWFYLRVVSDLEWIEM